MNLGCVKHWMCLLAQLKIELVTQKWTKVGIFKLTIQWCSQFGIWPFCTNTPARAFQVHFDINVFYLKIRSARTRTPLTIDVIELNYRLLRNPCSWHSRGSRLTHPSFHKHSWRQVYDPWRLHIPQPDSRSSKCTTHAGTPEKLQKNSQRKARKSLKGRHGLNIPKIPNQSQQRSNFVTHLAFNCQDTVTWPLGWVAVVLWCLALECWCQVFSVPLFTKRGLHGRAKRGMLGCQWCLSQMVCVNWLGYKTRDQRIAW